ncbi:MAG: response regulator transcription factor [Acidobacteria bacterium]|nr:response regulator transcription factor [Acidobacteriota bacterium]
MTTIVLADDHPFVRQGLRAVLQAEKEFQLLGEAENGLDAVRLVERLRPQVLIVDLMMPGLHGLQVTREVSKTGTQVVVLSMQADEPYVLEALRNGAKAYVMKDAPPQELILALREAAAGRRYLSSPLTERAIEIFRKASLEVPIDAYETLSDREREVLQLTAEGLSSTQIAERLFIGARTVETHRINLMRKLGLHNQTEMIRYAVRRGIVR